MTYLLALVCGVIYSLGFAPFDYWPLTCIAVMGLFFLLHREPAKPLLTAWWFGVGKYGLGASWVYVSIHVFGNAPVPLAVVMVCLFVALLAVLFCAPLGWLYGRLKTELRWQIPDVFLFTALWVFMDWVSTWLFTGFPWLLPGYAFMETFMLAAAPVVGVLGLGLLVVLACSALMAMLANRRLHLGLSILCLAPVLGGLLLNNISWVEQGREYTAALVQGNLDQTRKWLPEEAVPNVYKHMSLSTEHWDADILMWPEAAITMYPHQAQEVLDTLGEAGRATNTDIVLGIPSVQELPQGGYEFQNLAMGLGTASGHFAKHHLVPFGEYVPFESVLRGLIEFFDLPMSSSTPGAEYQRNIELSLGEAAMAICYEIAYPESMRQRSASSAVLMTITNDTWFGSSIGPLQHMQIARMRAVENGRWLLRASNNGVTGIVNTRGQVTATMPQFEAGVVRGSLFVMTGRTPFNIAGHWPTLIALVLMLAIAGWVRWLGGQRSD